MRYFMVLFLGISLNMAAQFNDAQTAFLNGQYDKTLSLIEGDESPAALLLKADVLHKMERLEEALEMYNLAENASTNDPNLFLNRGICLSTLGYTTAAEDDLLQFHLLEPNNPKVHYYLAVVDYLDENLREALFHINEALKLEDGYMEAHYLKGAVFVAQNKMISAKEAFEYCLQINPQNSRTLLNLGITMVESYEFAEAIETFDEAMKKDESLIAEALYYRGLANNGLHLKEEACADWNEAVKAGDKYANELVTQVCIKGKKPSRKQRKTIASF